LVTPNELREYVDTMRELGVLSFKHEGLEIALGPAPAGPPTRNEARAPRKSEYDRLLFACTEGLPEEDSE
jgi:hypothetical protein